MYLFIYFPLIDKWNRMGTAFFFYPQIKLTQAGIEL